MTVPSKREVELEKCLRDTGIGLHNAYHDKRHPWEECAAKSCSNIHRALRFNEDEPPPWRPTGWLLGDLVGFDLETTGVDPYTALPVQASFVHFLDGELVEADTFLIDPGVPIPEGASAVHGITDERVKSEGVPLTKALDLMSSWLRSSVAIFCGMNLRYDLTIVDQLRHRHGLSSVDGMNLRVVDVYVLDKQFDRYRKGKRNLGAMCEHYGVTLGDAHTAEADARATVHVLFKMMRRYAANKPELLTDAGLALLVKEQVNWYREQTRSLSEYFVSQGRPAIPEREMHWPVGPRDA